MEELGDEKRKREGGRVEERRGEERADTAL